jgi:hypothetical protein
MSEDVELRDEDREQIERAVAATPDIDHSILHISPPDKEGRVGIRTGWLANPKFGSGQMLEATKNAEGTWAIRLLGGWIS